MVKIITYPNNERLHDNIEADGSNFAGDYSGESLRSMVLKNCSFNGANFSDAALTGSRFENCTFEECEMDQGDFEYSDFIGGYMTSRHPIAISFNNSNFIDIRMENISFESSTFTNAFFDGVHFQNTTINNCTLEAVSFYHCRFHDTSLTNLNLNFSEFVDPEFKNCVFPQKQVLYTFGILQYMMSSAVSMELGDHNGKMVMDSDTYINQELPKLLKEYSDLNTENMRRHFFPLINILLAYKEKDKGVFYVKKAIQEAAEIEDLRMVRYYCKLISFCNLFSSGEKRTLYREICRHFHMEIMSPWQLKNYSRQMGEIRYTLLTESSLPTLIYYAATNIVGRCIENTGILIKHIMTLADKYKSTPLHDIKVEVTKNSPIHLTIYFTETIENIIALFKDLRILSDTPILENDSSNDLPVSYNTKNELRQYLSEYYQQDIKFIYMGFQIENWKKEYNHIFPIEG